LRQQQSVLDAGATPSAVASHMNRLLFILMLGSFHFYMHWQRDAVQWMVSDVFASQQCE
jgi:hypothetical protein